MSGANLDVLGKHEDLSHERSISSEPSCLQTRPRTELRHLGIEETCDVDDHRPQVRNRLYVKGFHDGVIVRRTYRIRNGLTLVGDNGIGHALEEYLVFAPIPPNHSVSESLTTIANSLCGAGNLTDPQKLASQLSDRNLVEDFAVEPMHGKDAVVGYSVVGDDLLIRLKPLLGRLAPNAICGGALGLGSTHVGVLLFRLPILGLRRVIAHE